MTVLRRPRRRANRLLPRATGCGIARHPPHLVPLVNEDAADDGAVVSPTWAVRILAVAGAVVGKDLTLVILAMHGEGGVLQRGGHLHNLIPHEL